MPETTGLYIETEHQVDMLEIEVKVEEDSGAKIETEANPARQGMSKEEKYLGSTHQGEG